MSRGRELRVFVELHLRDRHDVHGHEVDLECLPEAKWNQACARHAFAIYDDAGPTARMEPEHPTGVEQPQVAREGGRQMRDDDGAVLC